MCLKGRAKRALEQDLSHRIIEGDDEQHLMSALYVMG